MKYLGCHKRIRDAVGAVWRLRSLRSAAFGLSLSCPVRKLLFSFYGG